MKKKKPFIELALLTVPIALFLGYAVVKAQTSFELSVSRDYLSATPPILTIENQSNLAIPTNEFLATFELKYLGTQPGWWHRPGTRLIVEDVQLYDKQGKTIPIRGSSQESTNVNLKSGAYTLNWQVPISNTVKPQDVTMKAKVALVEAPNETTDTQRQVYYRNTIESPFLED